MKLTAIFRHPESDLRADDALELEYTNWRIETEAVAKSYHAWTRASRDERRLAYSAYLAALDREERAASEYRHLAEPLQAR